jgi:hypothetical protein
MGRAFAEAGLIPNLRPFSGLNGVDRKPTGQISTSAA